LRSSQILGLGKGASSLALGFDRFADLASSAPFLDRFWEAGGNVLDTAWLYQGGRTERILGDWLRSRGVRSAAVIVAKGAHPPHCRPDAVREQLVQTLERLQTDHVDVYFLHRDDPDVPVGEFVDALDAEVRAGRIRGLVGGSNWTLERMDQAIAYAERSGRTQPGALSNQLSLAEMLQPVWPCTQSCFSPTWRAWLQQRQLPNFAWGCHARGFLAARAGRATSDSAEQIRVWHSAANLARRDRADLLARERGASVGQVALAYLRHQSFPVVSIIGPRTLEQLDDSLASRTIELTPEQVAWLEG